MARDVVFYPAVPDAASLHDLVCRAAWYLAPWAERMSAIRLWSGCDLPDPDPDSAGLDPDIVRYFETIRPLIRREAPREPADILDMASREAALLLVWRWPRGEIERVRVEAAAETVRARGGVVCDVDRQTAMNEGSHWLWGCLRAFGSEEEAVGECRARLDAFAARPMRSRAYVLGTGPSLADAASLDLADGDCIVSNSIVANRALLERLRPIAVTACDPIFHAGCSQYAAAFRAHLRRALESSDMYFFTAMRDYRHYLMALPAALHARIVALPFREDAPYNFDLRRDFHLYPAGNVLTLGLLPLAGTFYDRISAIGCDGRPVEQNGYFWSHHKDSQINDKMENIRLVHPAFFDRSYDDHYDDHCRSVARVIDAMECAGKRVDSVTPSHIPALRMRQAATRAAVADAVLVSVNPDARDHHGHWIGYDDRLAEACARLGAPFVALANLALRPDILKTRPHYRRAFRFDTWEVEAGGGVNLERISRFESRLEDEIARLRAVHPGKRLLLYMYTGSLPHALAIFRAVERFPDIRACVNTFWTCVMDCEKDGYLAGWGPFLRASAGHPRFQVFAITPRLKAIIAAETGANLPLLPHPSPSEGDDATANRLDALSARAPAGFSGVVLFPGGTTAGKGFGTTASASVALARKHPDLKVRVRAAIRDGSEPDASAAAADIERAGIDVLRHAMGPEDFLATIRAAGVVVLPYEQASWRYRNSGLAVDALYAGAPIVCFAGTWIGEIVARHGAGVAVSDPRPDALVEAVERVIADYPRYRANAIRAARAYRSANTWATLADSVFATLNPPAVQAPAAGASAADLAPIRWWGGAPSRLAAHARAGTAGAPHGGAGRMLARMTAAVGSLTGAALAGGGLLLAATAAALGFAAGQPALFLAGLTAVAVFGLACLGAMAWGRAAIHRALARRSPELAFGFRQGGVFVKRHRGFALATGGLASVLALGALASGVLGRAWNAVPSWLNAAGGFAGWLAAALFLLFGGAMAASVFLKLAREAARDEVRASAPGLKPRLTGLFGASRAHSGMAAADGENGNAATALRERETMQRIRVLQADPSRQPVDRGESTPS